MTSTESLAKALEEMTHTSHAIGRVINDEDAQGVLLAAASRLRKLERVAGAANEALDSGELRCEIRARCASRETHGECDCGRQAAERAFYNALAALDEGE